ncbi:MAG: hypothetical protein AAF619_08030 [Pseudomonadota bacterium]
MFNENANGVSGAGGTAGGSSNGTADLQSAFNEAIGTARETLQISTKGNATLNALRARPQ